MQLNPFRKRNPFNESYDHYTAFNQGDLVPVYTQEIYPGDTFRLTAWSFVRYAPMVSPKFGRDGSYLHFFFVPNRLVQDNWPTFITNGPTNSSDITWAHVVAPEGGWTKYSLPDYFGWQLGKAGLKASAFKIRAYNLIYNEWYRQEFLQSEVALSKADGEDSTTSLSIQKRNWRKDYFTRGLPFRQLGNPSTLVLADSSANVSVFGTGKALGLTDGTNNAGLVESKNSPYNLGAQASAYDANVGGSGFVTQDTFPQKAVGVSTDGTKSGLKGVADLSSVQAFSINALRIGTQVQRWMERSARGGNRYIENTLAHFGIRGSDARYFRPEYLGGGKAYTAFSEVLQTSSTDSTSPQGNMAGHGVNASKTASFTKSFEEHGWIIGIMSVMTDTMYGSQGIPCEDTRETYLDYMWPEFQHVGEVAIKNKEIYAQGPSVVDSDGNVVDEKTFAYKPIYDELRHRQSIVTSDMRDSLAFWSQARMFDSLPAFNGDFLKANHSNRVFAVTDDSVKHLWAQIHFEVSAVRPLARRGEPGFMDH